MTEIGIQLARELKKYKVQIEQKFEGIESDIIPKIEYYFRNSV